MHPILAAIFAQDWPKMSQDSPRQAQKGRRRSQDEPRPGHDEPRQAQNNPPRRAKIGPCTFGGFHGALLVCFRHTCEGGESWYAPTGRSTQMAPKTVASAFKRLNFCMCIPIDRPYRFVVCWCSSGQGLMIDCTGYDLWSYSSCKWKHFFINTS